MTATIARRPKPLPKILRDKAAEAGCEPKEYLVGVLASAPTNEEAARAIGVTRNTLYRWCQRLEIAVEVT
ncbi:hypothetical protein EDM76_14000 [bacterium]|nr:MAG: hypothetical protein EDM76_14000 [bacterium]MCL4230330.1 hypothetical protein [Dehalococcoidia bacterium]